MPAPFLRELRPSLLEDDLATVVETATLAEENSAPHRPWVGRPLPRLEDRRLITGDGGFVADVALPGMVFAAVLRSPHAHARIRHIDVAPALAMKGVLAAFTAADLLADGIGGIPWEICPPGLQGRSRFQGDPAVSMPQPILADRVLRYVGEPIVLVVGETLAAAMAGCEAIEIDVEELPSLTSTLAAVAPGAPQLHEEAPGNILFEATVGDAQATDAAFARAAHVVELTTLVPRLAAAPMETRGYVGDVDPATGRYTLYAAAGKPHPVRNTIASQILHIEPEQLRVVVNDIGGGFGAKNVVHAESVLVLFAARRLGRPVRWLSERSESFQSDMQGRDHSISASLALDADGRFLAIRYDSLAALGAYLAPRAVTPCITSLKVLSGPYRVQAVHGRVRAVFTNSVPTCPYRGAGAPEGVFAVERLVDLAADRLGIDPVELRRRNAIAPQDLPWKNPVGNTVHSVDLPGLLAGGAQSLITKRDHAMSDSFLRRGIGLSLSVEAYGVAFDEAAEIIADGRGFEIRIGTMSGGQSHETGYAQIAADRLGVAPDRIAVIQGDTALVRTGNGTGACRSMTVGGMAVRNAADALVAVARKIAAGLLQADENVITFRDGRFEILSSSPTRYVTWSDIIAAGPVPLVASASYRPEIFNFPAGCHRAEVDVDIETGVVTLVRYEVFHDSGNSINPLVVIGQLQGGVAQGIGAALMEAIALDRESGQVLTSSFLDYAIPRAEDLPDIPVHLMGTPCASNPLGIKAAGEAGPVAAPPAVVNAIVDALSEFGVEHIEMPATPERVWRAICEARNASR